LKDDKVNYFDVLKFRHSNLNSTFVAVQSDAQSRSEDYLALNKIADYTILTDTANKKLIDNKNFFFPLYTYNRKEKIENKRKNILFFFAGLISPNRKKELQFVKNSISKKKLYISSSRKMKI
jgi:hypothetical protein